jgi:hypothetical protein
LTAVRDEKELKTYSASVLLFNSFEIAFVAFVTAAMGIL